MAIFLRRSRWLSSPPPITWLNAITSLLARPTLQPILVQSKAIFSLAAVLLGGLVFGPGQAWAQTCATATTALSFTDANPNRPIGEGWVNHAVTGVPDPAGVTTVYTTPPHQHWHYQQLAGYCNPE